MSAHPIGKDAKKRKRTEENDHKSKKIKKTKTKSVKQASSPSQVSATLDKDNVISSKPFVPSDAPLPPLNPAPNPLPAPGVTTQEPKAPANENTRVDANSTSGHKTRFIAFIGNLPFTTTTEIVAKHFSKIKPTSIRHLSPKPNDPLPKGHRSKDPKPTSKGFAFLEFDNYDRMRSCLKLYHHSTFDDGISKARKINVELTAGGGGRGEGRKEKLKAKNTKLQEQRQRRAKQEEQEGKRKPRSSKKKDDAPAGDSKDVEKTAEVTDAAASQGEIHPSRMAQIRV